MAAIAISRSIPQCSECLRTYAFGIRLEYKAALGSLEHVRGKKRSRRGPATVPVRLLEDLKAFGPKGALVPVPMGRMRNSFFPSGVADYISVAELRTLRKNRVNIERDSLFGLELLESTGGVTTDGITGNKVVDPSGGSGPEQEQVVNRKATPERQLELFKIFVPNSLHFYRETISITLSKRTTKTSSAGEDLLRSREEEILEARKTDKPAIYGSVSTLDVYSAMKAALDTNDEASRIHFAEDNISFVTKGNDAAEDATKLKHIGNFTAEIKLLDADAPIYRTIRVIAQKS